MAIVPDFANQPTSFQPSMNAEVQPNSVHFKLQKDPFTADTLIVPDGLMIQVVTLWLQAHPQESIEIMRALKNKQRNELDIIRTVNSTKNRS